MFIQRVFILTLATGVASMCDWQPVKRSVMIGLKLSEEALQVTTDSTAGSEDLVHIWFYDAQGQIAGGIELHFSSAPEYKIVNCMDSSVPLPPNLPTPPEKVWRITSTGNYVVITCNEVQVVKFLLTTETCNSQNWESYWGRDQVQIKFANDDSASRFYIASNSDCKYPDAGQDEDCRDCYSSGTTFGISLLISLVNVGLLLA